MQSGAAAGVAVEVAAAIGELGGTAEAVGVLVAAGVGVATAVSEGQRPQVAAQ